MNETWFSQTSEAKSISRIPARPAGGHPAVGGVNNEY